MPSIRFMVAVVALAWVGSAFATVERAIEIAQPILVEDGIVLSRVTYVVHDDVDSWGRLVDYTCKESFVVNDVGKPENRNAANVAGIRAWVDPYHFQEQALFGDTVRVYIDFSEYDSKKLSRWDGDVVAATIECVLVNATHSMNGWCQAKNSWITAKYLDVEIRGAPELARLTQTYLLTDLVGKVPRVTHFGEEDSDE